MGQAESRRSRTVLKRRRARSDFRAHSTLFAAVSCAACTGQVIGDGSSPGRSTADASATTDSASALTLSSAAAAISARCLAAPCIDDLRLNLNETQILFAAVAEETGIHVRLLKAIAYGEAIATAYDDKWPRHFIDLEHAPGLLYQSQWASAYLGVELPVMLGDDREFDSPTFGLGIMQTTATIDEIRKALDEFAQASSGDLECGALRYDAQADWPHPELTCQALLLGGGVPGSYWNHEVRMDVDRVIRDPYYAVLVAARLIRHKIDIYSHPDRPGGPLPWVSPNPDAEADPEMAWALVGSTYQTYGGYGPGGGATTRIYNRITGIDAEAWPFVSEEADLEDFPRSN